MDEKHFGGVARANLGTPCKSLFCNILHLTVLFSRFYADKKRHMHGKFNKTNILADMDTHRISSQPDRTLGVLVGGGV